MPKGIVHAQNQCCKPAKSEDSLQCDHSVSLQGPSSKLTSSEGPVPGCWSMSLSWAPNLQVVPGALQAEGGKRLDRKSMRTWRLSGGHSLPRRHLLGQDLWSWPRLGASALLSELVRISRRSNAVCTKGSSGCPSKGHPDKEASPSACHPDQQHPMFSHEAPKEIISNLSSLEVYTYKF